MFRCDQDSGGCSGRTRILGVFQSDRDSGRVFRSDRDSGGIPGFVGGEQGMCGPLESTLESPSQRRLREKRSSDTSRGSLPARDSPGDDEVGIETCQNHPRPYGVQDQNLLLVHDTIRHYFGKYH